MEKYNSNRYCTVKIRRDIYLELVKMKGYDGCLTFSDVLNLLLSKKKINNGVKK